MGRFSRGLVSLGKQDFLRVLQENAQSADSNFLMFAQRNDLPISRLGVSITKKRTLKAPARNRIKRLIRESFYQQQPLPVQMDIVVMSRRQVEKKSNKQILSILDAHWQRVLKKFNLNT